MRARALVPLLAFLTVAPPALADVKLAYVDLQKALGEVAEGREAKARLKAEVDRTRAEMEREQTRLRDDKLVLDKQGSMMSEEVRAQRLGEWQRRLLEITQKAERRQQELQDRERTELRKIFDKMDPIISAIAQREALTVVLEKTDSGLLYAQPGLDLTPELVKTYNERHPAAARPGPAAPRKDAGP
jgi:outer membrane protein